MAGAGRQALYAASYKFYMSYQPYRSYHPKTYNLKPKTCRLSGERFLSQRRSLLCAQLLVHSLGT